jgi:hypothetical protein
MRSVVEAFPFGLFGLRGGCSADFACKADGEMGTGVSSLNNPKSEGFVFTDGELGTDGDFGICCWFPKAAETRCFLSFEF